MAMRLIRQSAKNVPWITEKALASIRKQSLIDRAIGPRMSKPCSPSEFWTAGFLGAIVGPKDLGAPAHFE